MSEYVSILEAKLYRPTWTEVVAADDELVGAMAGTLNARSIGLLTNDYTGNAARFFPAIDRVR